MESEMPRISAGEIGEENLLRVASMLVCGPSDGSSSLDFGRE